MNTEPRSAESTMAARRRSYKIIGCMDMEMYRRWMHGLPRFDGLTLHPGAEPLPWPDVRRAVHLVLTHLESRWRDQTLHSAWDWHGLLALADSDDARHDTTSHDHYVSMALFPDQQEFYFRF